MDDKAQVIACLVIYSDNGIACQCGFQVFDAVNKNTFSSRDGGEFNFIHSYRDMVCDLEVSYSKGGLELAQCELAVPINRTKIKWKRYDLNGYYSVHYRCQLEEWNRGKLRRERNKMRRNAAVGRTPMTFATIYHKGNVDGDETPSV